MSSRGRLDREVDRGGAQPGGHHVGRVAGQRRGRVAQPVGAEQLPAAPPLGHPVGVEDQRVAGGERHRRRGRGDRRRAGPARCRPAPTNDGPAVGAHQHRPVVAGQVQRRRRAWPSGAPVTAASASVQYRPPPRSTSVSLSRASDLGQRLAVADQDADHVADQAGHRRRPARPCRTRRRPRPASGRPAAAPRRRSRRRPRRRRRSARTRRRSRRPSTSGSAGGSSECCSVWATCAPLVVDPGVVDGQRGPPGHVLQHRHLVGVVPVSLVPADRERAEPLPAGDQRRPRSPPIGAPSGTWRRSRDASRSRAWIESRRRSRASALCSCGSADSSAWVAAASCSRPHVVGGVHRAPLAEPGHHELRDQRHGQVDVERLGEQLAGLGQERQPGLPAPVGPAQPVVLQVAARAARRRARPAAGRTPPAPASSSSSPGHGRCTGSGTRIVRLSSRRCRPTGRAVRGRRRRPRSRRTTPPAAPVTRRQPAQQARSANSGSAVVGVPRRAAA